MNYIKVKEAAEKWGLSDRRIRVLCELGRIPGAIKQGKTYYIPQDAEKPSDGRFRQRINYEGDFSSSFFEIDCMKNEMNSRRPLTEGELMRLRDEFLIEFTYHSNAIEGNTLTLQETALVLEGITIDRKPLKDHLEAVGHKPFYMCNN